MINKYISTVSPSSFTTEMVQKAIWKIPTPGYISSSLAWKLLEITADEQNLYSFASEGPNLYSLKFSIMEMG
jgi:hypothetical protein